MSPKITKLSFSSKNNKDFTLWIKEPGKAKKPFETLYNSNTAKAWSVCCSVKGALNSILPQGSHARVEQDMHGNKL